MGRNENHYIVATLKPWNIETYHRIIAKYPGEWSLVTSEEGLASLCSQSKPRYVFFPHWSSMVPGDLVDSVECVCFHETDLPLGRGGSPVQNLIASRHDATWISAIRMTDKLDAGPVYLKRPLSLEGLGEEIFIRSSLVVASMILEIISNNPAPSPQVGEATYFKRRTPDMSDLPKHPDSLKDIFDHIRMLDAETYPRAFLLHDGLQVRFSRPALRVNHILCDAEITIEDDPETK